MIYLEKDTELFRWLWGIRHQRAGSFLQAVADAAFGADPYNYQILRPALLELKAKYPKYWYGGKL